MSGYIIQFFTVNLYITAFILFLLCLHLVRGRLISSRTIYNLWYILFILLSVPFVPFQVSDVFPHLFRNILSHGNSRLLSSLNQSTHSAGNLFYASQSVNDFTISVIRYYPSSLERIIPAVWLTGMIVLLIRFFLTSKKIKQISSDALPVQDNRVKSLYRHCLQESGIARDIPIFSTASLKSPMIVGLFRARIYIPSRLISDFKETDLRYMLLHELMHVIYKDAAGNLLINAALVLYWYNPFLWISARVMRTDREMACDEAVLYGLDQWEYMAYGNVLINHIEDVSLQSRPFVMNLSAGFKSLKKRILNISQYRRPALPKRVGNIYFFLSVTLTAAITSFCLPPSPALNAYDRERYDWKQSFNDISLLSYQKLFHRYKGSFVLFDASEEKWSIYNPELAVIRYSPDSTYKIYDALFALDRSLITPHNSERRWDGTVYPFDTWQRDQDLNSAIRDSVNWYFQELDKEIGIRKIEQYIHTIGYGNRRLAGDSNDYWLESSLKISPVEQVELLKRFHEKELPFSEENLSAVKDALRIEDRGNTVLYGKTGTGRVNEKDINGWFVGFVEKGSHTYYFAVNIHADEKATGKAAYGIALGILSDMGIWNK